MLQAEELRARGLDACLGPPPVILEIGFGRADLILVLAAAHPERRFLGVEVSRRRVVKAGRRVQQRGLGNLRLVHAPAEYLLERVLPPRSVEECWINCPDPWPKKRHHKRRLVSGRVLGLLREVMLPGAVLHLSTDHPGYARWIHQELARASAFRNLHAPHPWSSRPPDRPETAYEVQWRAEGRSLLYFDYRLEDR